MKRIFVFIFAIVLSFSALVSCGGGEEYNDGVYEGKSSVYSGDEDDGGAGYGVVTITIKDNLITACTFNTFEPDGTQKDENYGKQNGEIANRDYYNRAQRALRANATYEKAIVAYGSLDKVDAVSGATISFGQFKEAVENALQKAIKK